MSQTNSMAVFANGDRCTAEMSLGEECRDVWRVITDNRQLRARLLRTPLRHTVYRLRRQDERSDPLELLDRIIVAMAACGYPESTAELLITHLKGVKARCYHVATRPIAELDSEQMKLSHLDGELELARLHAGEIASSELLEQEAMTDELEAGVQLERARVLREIARTEPKVLEFRRDFPRPRGATPS